MSSRSLLNSTVGQKADFAPSILFTALYAVLLPVGVWRLCKRSTRTVSLALPLVFCAIRMGTYIVRAFMARGNRTTGMITAELVLLSAASYFLIEPLITLSRKLLERSVPYEGPTVNAKGKKIKRNDRIGWLGTVLDLALLAAPIISIYSGAITSKAFRDPHTAHTVLQLRRGGAIIFVIVVGLVLTALAYYHFLERALNRRSTYFLLMAGLLAMVPCAFKLAQAYQTAGANTTAAFWLAQAVPEIILALAYFSINLNSLVPAKPQDVEMARLGSAEPQPQQRQDI